MLDQGSNRPRVLIVNSALAIGGAEQVSALLAERLDRSRFDVAACYLKEPGAIAEQMQRAGVDVAPIPGLRVGKRDYLTFLKLRRMIRERGVNVIHTHDVHGLMDGAACKLTTPGLRHVHTFHFGNYPHRGSWNKFIEGKLWRVPDAVIAVGHEQAARIRSLYRIPQDRLRVLWNGVEDPGGRGTPEAIPGLEKSDVPMIASVSTLITQKGLEHLLDAVALLRADGARFRLAIAGHGALHEPLKERARTLGLDNVIFLGWIPQAAQRLLPMCDIFVQSSLWEAMSMVVLEAMAAGKAMAVTSVGENNHVVQNELTGLIVEPGDPKALAAALGRLLGDPALRLRLGNAARARYQETFTTSHMVAAHEDLYRELALRSARRRPALAR